jgi:hypothetical protein
MDQPQLASIHAERLTHGAMALPPAALAGVDSQREK